MKSFRLFLIIFILSACNLTNTKGNEKITETPDQLSKLAILTDFGEAPELTNETWLNTPEPLRLADLRGQVVLLEMWTFG